MHTATVVWTLLDSRLIGDHTTAPYFHFPLAITPQILIFIFHWQSHQGSLFSFPIGNQTTAPYFHFNRQIVMNKYRDKLTNDVY